MSDSDVDVYTISMSSTFGDVHARISRSELERSGWVALVQPRPASQPDRGSFPNTEEADLLRWIPSEIADTCHRSLAGPVPPYSDAALTCSASGIDADYERFTSTDTLHRDYEEILMAQHIDTGAGPGCPEVPSEQPWSFPGSTVDEGRVVCFTFSSSFVIGTFERAGVEVSLSSQVGAPIDPLWNAWRSGLLLRTPRD